MISVKNLMTSLNLSFQDTKDTILLKWDNTPESLKNQNSLLLIKALIDPYYKTMLQYYDDLNLLLPGGFFDDGQKPGFSNYKELFFSTPVYKLLNNLKNTDNSKEIVIMLSTGSYSPIHSGHINMMELAYEELSKKYNVLGGYLSPSHDNYVSQKYNGTAKLNSEIRIDLCESMVYQHPYLMIDSWEARYNNCPINFTDVIIHLKKIIRKFIKQDFKIAYVFGSDNAGFSWAFLKDDVSVCILRKNYEQPFHIVKNDIMMKENNYFITNNNNAFSSQEIRKGNLSLTSEIVQNKFNKFKNEQFPILSKNYIIRDDFKENTPFYVSDENYQFFKQNFDHLLKKAFLPFENINTVYIDVPSQRKILNDIVETYPQQLIVNNDFLTQSTKTLNINLSRLFQLSNGQINTHIITNRLNSPPVENQINSITSDFIFVDDDIASGTTIKLIQSLSKFKINHTISLCHEYLKKNNLSLDFHDIIDLRDFVIGFNNSGLTVSIHDQIFKVPYILPFVSLSSRAKIPHINLTEFSKSIWNLNFLFYQKIDPKLKISDLNSSFYQFSKFLGFDDNTTIAEFCLYHIKAIP